MLDTLYGNLSRLNEDLTYVEQVDGEYSGTKSGVFFNDKLRRSVSKYIL